jgi:aryl-alcohol dehydrogenase-like predicted oxidoreductase
VWRKISGLAAVRAGYPGERIKIDGARVVVVYLYGVRTRPLGKTGLDVSELSLGTWGLSGDGYGVVPADEADRTIDRAVEAGITLFDTADVYGGGAMETRLGQRLTKEALICTKIGTDLEQKPPRKVFTPKYLRVAFERSRERIAREKIDIVLLHNPTMAALGAGEAVGFIKGLKEQGSIGLWGVSVGSVEVAREAITRGADVIELVYNVVFASDLHELAADISEAGTGVLARSTLAHGLLAGQWSADREFAPGDHRADRWKKDELRRRISHIESLRPMVSGPVASLRSAALRFVLSNQIVSSAVLGPRSVFQLNQLITDAGEGPPYLRDTALAALSNRLKSVGVLA